MLVESTPETTNPVADQCEANGVPCISTVAPWQPYFFARQADPADPKPFDWTYHFFWGLEDIIAVFLDMWSQVDDQQDGRRPVAQRRRRQRLERPEDGLPAGPHRRRLHDRRPGTLRERHAGRLLRADQRVQEGRRRDPDRRPHPARLHDLLDAGSQQGFKPKVASIGKALLFPSSVEALGDLGDGHVDRGLVEPQPPVQVVAHRRRPRRQLADAYTTATTKQWTQPIGFVHALFEVAVDALKRATRTSTTRPPSAMPSRRPNLDTIVGPIAWTHGKPFQNIAKTPLVGGQWGKGTDVPVRPRHRQQQGPSGHPRGGHDAARSPTDLDAPG